MTLIRDLPFTDLPLRTSRHANALIGSDQSRVATARAAAGNWSLPTVCRRTGSIRSQSAAEEVPAPNRPDG